MEKKARHKQARTRNETTGDLQNPGSPQSRLDPWQAGLCKLPVTLAYAAVIDTHQVECEITDKMVLQACQDIESMQQFPFAPKNSA